MKYLIFIFSIFIFYSCWELSENSNISETELTRIIKSTTNVEYWTWMEVKYPNLKMNFSNVKDEYYLWEGLNYQLMISNIPDNAFISRTTKDASGLSATKLSEYWTENFNLYNSIFWEGIKYSKFWKVEHVFYVSKRDHWKSKYILKWTIVTYVNSRYKNKIYNNSEEKIISGEKRILLPVYNKESFKKSHNENNSKISLKLGKKLSYDTYEYNEFINDDISSYIEKVDFIELGIFPQLPSMDKKYRIIFFINKEGISYFENLRKTNEYTWPIAIFIWSREIGYLREDAILTYDYRYWLNMNNMLWIKDLYYLYSDINNSLWFKNIDSTIDNILMWINEKRELFYSYNFVESDFILYQPDFEILINDLEFKDYDLFKKDLDKVKDKIKTLKK